MKKEFINELNKLIKEICEKKDKSFSEKQAEELRHRIQSLWSSDHTDLDQEKGKDAVKEAIENWYEAKSYKNEISIKDIDKMAEAVFSKGEYVKAKPGMYNGSLARKFVLPDVPYVKEVLAVKQLNASDYNDYNDYSEYQFENDDAYFHNIGIRLRIDLFPELCSDPDTLLALYKRLNNTNFTGSDSILVDKDYNSFFYSLKAILTKIYRIKLDNGSNIKETQQKKSPLTEAIVKVSKDVSKKLELDYALRLSDANDLVSRINDLFEKNNYPLSFDTNRLKGTLLIAAQRYISDKNEAEKVIDLVINNPFDDIDNPFERGLDDIDTYKIFQLYKSPKTNADKVIELTVPETGAALYAFRLKGDLFTDSFPRYFSTRSFLYKLWFKINDEYICGSKVYSHDFDESLLKFYEELAMVLQIVFKEDVKEEVRKRISNNDEEINGLLYRKRMPLAYPLKWTMFTETAERYDIPNWTKLKEIFEKSEADYLYHVIDHMSYESRCALFMVAKGYRPKKDKTTGKPISGGNVPSITSSKEDRKAIANASESELIEYADKLKAAFYSVMNDENIDKVIFSPAIYFERSENSNSHVANESDNIVSDENISIRQKRYKAKDIYSLYREIALEFADCDESHVGIYHALYAIAYITEKMTLDELIFEVGDYDKAEYSEKNKRIILVCEAVRYCAQGRINLQTVLKVFPLYKNELNENFEENILLSRNLLSDFTEMTIDPLISNDQTWKIKSLEAVLSKDSLEDDESDWKSEWRSVNRRIMDREMDFRNALSEESIASSLDGRFWIESNYVLIYGVKELRSQPYRPLAIAFHLDAPTFDALESIGDKNKGFIEAVESGEDYYTSLINGFTDQKGRKHEKITGQDHALRKFIDTYEYALMFNKDPDRPLATYLFVGPPGVGKTMLAENAAALIGKPFKRFDMSEYPGGGNEGTADVDGLIGFEKTYKNAKPGVLTDYVYKHPNSVLLFDEIEKAGTAVARLFLSVLEGARLTDKFTEKTVSFSKTILIFTTNAGKDLYENNEDIDLSTISDGAIIEALRGTNEKKFPNSKGDQDTFPPELVSRFATSSIILFNHLDKLALKGIAESGFKAIQDESRKSEERFEVILDDERLSSAYMYSQSKLDARILSSGSRKFLGGKVRDAVKKAKMLSNGGIKGLKIQFSVDIDNVKDKEIKSLFLPLRGQDITEENTLRALCVTDRKDQEMQPIWLKKDRVCTFDDFRYMIENTRDPYDMFIIDLSTGGNMDIFNNTAEGVRCLNEIADNPGNQTICVVTGEIKLSDLDKEMLLKKGVSKFLPADESSEEWERAASDTYIKRSIRILEEDGNVLGFDTAIELKNKAEKTVQVRLTNFRYCEAELEDADTRRRDMDSLVSESGRPKIKIEDIIGAESAKQQLHDIIEYVKNPAKYEIMNCPAPRGLLLHGFPGTGKTMLAKALAGETKMAFIATTGSKLASKGAEGVQYIFDLARRKRKAIIFIDEFDTLGSVREGHQTAKEFAVNRLLTEMDGFSSDKKKLIYVLAATNAAYEDRDFGIDVRIDEAVARRFGKSLVVELPLKQDRKLFIGRRMNELKQTFGDDSKIIAEDIKYWYESEKKKRAEEFWETIDVAADLTGGKSLAVIESYIQNCVRHAIRESHDDDCEIYLMSRDEFLNYLQEELFGDSNEAPKDKDCADNKTENKIGDPVYHTAIHEAGHALISCITGNQPSILTISGRGNYAGFYLSAEKNDNRIPTRRDTLNKIDVALAGGIAETLIFGEEEGTTTGVSSDLENATGIARKMITKWGMTDNIAVIRNDRLIDRAIGDTALSKELLSDINNILRQEKKRTKELIEKNKDILIELTDAVYTAKGKYLTGEEIKSICSKAKQ